MFSAHIDGFMALVDTRNEEIMEGLASKFSFHKASTANESRWTCGYSLKTLKDMTRTSSMVSCAEDGTLVLWRFIVGSIKCETRGALMVPVPCRRLQVKIPLVYLHVFFIFFFF